MGIGNRIKEARECLGLTQTELGDMVGVTGSAITNYEKEISHPKEPIMYKLIDALNVDANYLFQDVVKPKQPGNEITLAEFNIIKQYRDLDDHGKEMVDLVLEKEHSRCIDYIVNTEAGPVLIESQTPAKNTDRLRHYNETLMAAHNNHADEPGELEKMRDDLTGLKRP